MRSRAFTQRVARILALVTAMAGLPALAGNLRVCADPDNLPFSKADGPERGLYVELADMVAQRIGESAEYVWWLTYNQRRALRNSMDGCDAYFALPANADYRVRGLVKTRPFLDVSYAIVAPASLQVKGLADLQGKRIGVLHGSPPHILLASREGYTSTSFRETGEAMAALARGEVDAAILWGPSAGYDNQRQFAGRWAVTPVSGDGLGGGVSVAVRREREDLVGRIDQALVDLQPQIRALARKYGFPLDQPLPLAASRVAPPQREPVRTAEVRVPSTWVVRTATTAQEASVDVSAARARFNDTCSHCHGKDGASPISERDLRKLRMRYKDDWNNVALKTIREGRPEQGMPTWKATFTDEQIQGLLGFLGTIQK